jgi:hypothetical protein
LTFCLHPVHSVLWQIKNYEPHLHQCSTAYRDRLGHICMQVISEAVKKAPGAVHGGGGAGSSAQAAPKPKPLMVGRKSKSSAFLSSLAKQKRPQKTPTAGIARLLTVSMSTTCPSSCIVRKHLFALLCIPAISHPLQHHSTAVQV